MNPRNAIYGKDAREKLSTGVKKLTEAVACTLGPGGRNVVLMGVAGYPRSTKDGVTVAREFALEDLVENAGARACQIAASKANELAGDGTTTATVLTNSLLHLGLQLIEDGGANPHLFKQGLTKASEDLIQKLNEMAVKIDSTDSEMVEQIATISGNDPEVGKIVADAFSAAGPDGFVQWEMAKGLSKSEIEVTDGMTFDGTYESPWFINDKKNEAVVYNDPVVVLYGGMVSAPQDLLPFLDRVLQKYKDRPIVMITGGLDGEALKAAVMNFLQGNIQLVAIRAPISEAIPRDEAMQDIGAFCGAEYVPEGVIENISKATIEILGNVSKVTVTKNKTELILHPDNKENLDKYIEELKEVPGTEERVAMLKAKVSMIKIGGNTPAEIAELQYRYEDAVNAVKAALKKGVLPGGGAGLIVAASKIRTKDKRPDFVKGYESLLEGIKAPMYQILQNSGVDIPEDITSQIARKNKRNFIWTIDGLTGNIVKAYKNGILDPVAVTESSLQAAVSIAGLYCTTDCVVSEIVKD